MRHRLYGGVRGSLCKGALYSIKLLADTESCDLNIRNSEETPILLNCIQNEKLGFVQYLITKKADVNIELEHKLTCIYLTVDKKKFEFFKFLIDNKANVNAKDKSGDTILHFCIKESNVTEDYFENVKYVCEKGGADLSIKDAKGKTPLEIALDKNNFTVALYFINLIKPLIEKMDIAAQAIKPIKQNHIYLSDFFTDKVDVSKQVEDSQKFDNPEQTLTDLLISAASITVKNDGSLYKSLSSNKNTLELIKYFSQNILKDLLSNTLKILTSNIEQKPLPHYHDITLLNFLIGDVHTNDKKLFDKNCNITDTEETSFPFYDPELLNLFIENTDSDVMS